MEDEARTESDDFDAVRSLVWELVRMLIDNEAHRQRSGLFRRTPRAVKLSASTMTSISLTAADFYFPPEEWSGDLSWEEVELPVQPDDIG
jgi:hypothetical protein